MVDGQLERLKVDISRDVLSGKAGVQDPYCGKCPPSSIRAIEVSDPKFCVTAVKRNRRVAGIAERGRTVYKSLQDYLSGSFLDSPNLDFQYPTAWEHAHEPVLPSFTERKNDVVVNVFSGIGNKYDVKLLLDYPGVKNIRRRLSWLEPTSGKTGRNYGFRKDKDVKALSVYRFPIVWDIGARNLSLGIDVDLAYEVLSNQLEFFTSSKIERDLNDQSSRGIDKNTFRKIVISRTFDESLLSEGIIRCWLFDNMDKNGFSRDEIRDWSPSGVRRKEAQEVVPAIGKIGGASNAAFAYRVLDVGLRDIVEGSITPEKIEAHRRKIRGWS